MSLLPAPLFTKIVTGHDMVAVPQRLIRMAQAEVQQRNHIHRTQILIPLTARQLSVKHLARIIDTSLEETVLRNPLDLNIIETAILTLAHKVEIDFLAV